MEFRKKIDLFKLTEIVVKRFRRESGLKLDGYEFKFEYKRDWNCPINRINFNLLIFGGDYTHSRFDEKYDTEEKVAELFFVHLRDDAGVQNLKDCLISAKRFSMERRTQALSKKIKALSDAHFGQSKVNSLTTMVDEKHPYDLTYENGFPIMQYQVYNQSGTIRKYYDLGFHLREFDENEVYNEISEIVNTTSNDR